jgi:hypothetical protein
MNFWLDNWSAILVWALGTAALVGVAMFARRNPDANASKAVFFLVPALNPSRAGPAVSTWAWWLVIAVVLVIAIQTWLDR